MITINRYLRMTEKQKFVRHWIYGYLPVTTRLVAKNPLSNADPPPKAQEDSPRGLVDCELL